MAETTTATILKQFVNVTKAAELLGVTGAAVRSLAARGHLDGAIEPAASPSGQWLIPLAAITARQRKKRANKLPLGGFPAHKRKICKDLSRAEKTSKNRVRKPKIPIATDE